MSKEKIIRGSRRGLTFSLPSCGAFCIGAHYDYEIETQGHPVIRIVPSSSGRYKLSRKKNGQSWSSLIDLRNKEILELLSGMKRIRVCLTEDEIVVSDATEKASSSCRVLQFRRSDLVALRHAAGLSDFAAVDSLLDGAQITLDEFLSSQNSPLSISNIHRDLPDVYTLVSLFSGAGILDWPFAQDPRFSIQYAIDSDTAACKTYQHNIGMHIVHGDIHKAFTKDGYPQDKIVDNPDALIGGPSCKPFSNANRSTRLQDHPDSDLVMQYMRIVKILRPKVFAMENVPYVLTACDGAYFDEIKRVASECGYELNAQVVQDNLVGGYTTRRRAIILGSRIGKPMFGPIAIALGKTVGDAFRKIEKTWSNYTDVTLPGPDTVKRMSFVPQGGNFESIPEEYRTASRNRHSCTYRRLDLSAPSPTIVNWRKPPLIHPTENRTLTVAEAKALQGLPGNFRIFGSLGQMQQQVGNSVPVAIGRFIKTALLRLLEHTATFEASPAL